MTQTLPDTREISRKGQRLLDSLQSHFSEQDHGKFVAIDVESGEHFVGETAIEATERAQAEHPGKLFFLGRIGYRTAFTFKGRR